jgi:hypothetical protein
MTVLNTVPADQLADRDEARCQPRVQRFHPVHARRLPLLRRVRPRDRPVGAGRDRRFD